MRRENWLKLTPRLQAVAGLVLPGQPVVDIGSDHGYLPIYLITKGIVPSAIAVEVQAGPLARTERQVRLSGLADKIQVRLGDGLKPVLPGEASTAVMAGMGTQTIIRILSQGEEVANSFKRLVLQPMVEVPVLREWLYRHGHYISHEELVEEGERYYVVLAARAGQQAMPSPLELELGPVLMANKHPLLKGYLEKMIRQERQVLSELAKVDSPKARRQQQRLAAKLNELEEVMKWLSCARP